MRTALHDLRPEELLEHAAWMRALARRLVLEGDRVDDVVQEAWKAALASAPRSRSGLRPWLAAVVRNQALLRRRGDARREARERLASTTERVASTAELAERADLQRAIVELVGGLPETYRTVVLLRYFDDRKPAWIATHLGVPVETVRTRLARAHERLRAGLDRLHRGDRTAWSLALLPLAALDRATTGTAGLSFLKTSSLGAWIMLHPVRSFVLVLVFAIAGLLGWKRLHPSVPDLARHGTAAEAAQVLVAARATHPSPLTAPERSSVGSAGRNAVVAGQDRPSSPAPARLATELVVEAYDELGQAVPRFDLSARPADPARHARRDAQSLRRDRSTYDGRMSLTFEVGEPTALKLRLMTADQVVSERAVTLTPGRPLAVRFDLDLEVPEPGTDSVLTGRVVDADTGEPVAGALLHVSTRPESAAPHGGYQLMKRMVQTRLDGSFRVALPADAFRAFVGVAHPHLPFQVFDELECDSAALLRVRRKGVLTVRVVDRHGAPVCGAHLLVHEDRGSSGSDESGGIVGADDMIVRSYGARATTGPDGTATFRHLGDGNHRVYLLPRPRAVDDFAVSRHGVRMRQGEDRTFELRIDPPDRTHVTGHVAHALSDAPALIPLFVPNGTGESGWIHARPANDGFDAGGLARGTYLVVLTPPNDDFDGPYGFLPGVEVDGLVEQELDFALPTGSLEGVVKGAVPHGARVVVRPVLPEGFAAEFLRELDDLGGAVPDENGRFRVEHLADGPHRVELRARETLLATREAVVSGATVLGPWVVE